MSNFKNTDSKTMTPEQREAARNQSYAPYKDSNDVPHIDSRFKVQGKDGELIPAGRIIATKMKKAAARAKHIQRFGQVIPKYFNGSPMYC